MQLWFAAHALCLILVKISSSLYQAAMYYKKLMTQVNLDGAVNKRYVHFPWIDQQQSTSWKLHTATTASSHHFYITYTESSQGYNSCEPILR